MRSTKSLTRDGITYTAEFRETIDGDGYHLLGLTLGAAGQAIDLMKGIPTHWTEEARDAEFIKRFPALAMLSDAVFLEGVEVFAEVGV